MSLFHADDEDPVVAFPFELSSTTVTPFPWELDSNADFDSSTAISSDACGEDRYVRKNSSDEDLRIEIWPHASSIPDGQDPPKLGSNTDLADDIAKAESHNITNISATSSFHVCDEHRSFSKTCSYMIEEPRPTMSATVIGSAGTLQAPRRRKRKNQETSSELLPHATVKQPQVEILVPSSDVNIFDGYDWLKYGQKDIKGQTQPRSYFHCASHGPPTFCTIKKQVQFSSEADGYLSVYYIGRHNHPNPIHSHNVKAKRGNKAVSHSGASAF
ncbi:hypothetical protein KP509_14G044100 [Ceratopteris richardii]|uniref:WRKY domain-containing protein n=1 Tax=Ceratopteris richardii TaxID=49495 RepID=A0A8T2T7I5_CERRI|nr:hypothetical protein KP509_14G044100 [Ceratopteris richardii]